MAAKRRWTREQILDTAAEVLRTTDADSFSVRRVAARLGTDSSSLYRHFRNKTELLREVSDRVLAGAMEGFHPSGDWRQDIVAAARRVHDAFLEQPQLAVVWGRYVSGGTGSRRVMDVVLQALLDAGFPEDQVPAKYHRLAVLISGLIGGEGALGAAAPTEREQGREQFRVAVLGADPQEYPALARFAQSVQPLSADRSAAFEEILHAHLAQLEAELG